MLETRLVWVMMVVALLLLHLTTSDRDNLVVRRMWRTLKTLKLIYPSHPKFGTLAQYIPSSQVWMCQTAKIWGDLK